MCQVRKRSPDRPGGSQTVQHIYHVLETSAFGNTSGPRGFRKRIWVRVSTAQMGYHLRVKLFSLGDRGTMLRAERLNATGLGP